MQLQKYICMSLIFGIEVPVYEGNGHVFPQSISNLDLFWNFSIRMDGQTLAYPEVFFFYVYSA